MARINSRQVEAFRATMLTGSVTEAAALMTVTQPAVSRLLRDLQALLKMELFERRGTGLVPTAAAMALYTEVERSFVGLERITAAAEEIRGRRTGSLRIAALPALSNGYLPRLAGHFLKERPNLNLAFFGVISPIVVDWVLNNQCDVGFAEVPIAHSGLPSRGCRRWRASRCCRPVIASRKRKCWSRATSRARRSSRCRRARRAATSSTRSSIATMSAACCGSRPRCRRSCAAWCRPGLASQSAIPSPRRNFPPAASSCAASCRASTSNSRRSFRAAQPLAGGTRSGRDHAQGARRIRGATSQPLNAACASGRSQILPIAAVPAAVIAASSAPR